MQVGLACKLKIFLDFYIPSTRSPPAPFPTFSMTIALPTIYASKLPLATMAVIGWFIWSTYGSCHFSVNLLASYATKFLLSSCSVERMSVSAALSRTAALTLTCSDWSSYIHLIIARSSPLLFFFPDVPWSGSTLCHLATVPLEQIVSKVNPLASVSSISISKILPWWTWVNPSPLLVSLRMWVQYPVCKQYTSIVYPHATKTRCVGSWISGATHLVFNCVGYYFDIMKSSCFNVCFFKGSVPEFLRFCSKLVFSIRLSETLELPRDLYRLFDLVTLAVDE